MKMKKMNKLMSIALVLNLLVISLVGCGKDASPAIGEGVVVDTEESSIEAEEKEMPDGKVPAIDKIEEVTNPTVKPTDEPITTTEPEPEPEPTESPHVHEYKEAVTKQATCAEAGEKKLVCECGDTKVETVPATGNHDWEPIYQTVTHPSLGHVEEVETQIQVGTEMRQEYECMYCGARFDTPAEKTEHCKATGDFDHAMARTMIYDIPGSPIYETRTEAVWIVDTPEYTTQEMVGQKCTVCETTK